MTADDKWYSLEITAAPEAAEAVEFALNSLDALGTSINHLRKANADSVTVVGYFNVLPEDQSFQDEMHYALRTYGFADEIVSTVERGLIENADWLAEWKKHWKPTEIGRFVIAPPWYEIGDTDKIVIRIEPNMAFGTGTHETTKLCIAEIDRLYEPGDSFLDVGTGTGILAIAAGKLATTRPNFFAVDTDHDSIVIARENALANGVDFIEFEETTLSPKTPQYDFVCANLTIDVILPILDMLLEKAGKTLIMSGILQEQEPMIVKALIERSCNDYRVERLGEWISVIVR